jgi:hypothetical protein
VTLVWRWKTVADPCRPRTGPAARRIPHPLADRVGQPVRELARGRNNSRLLEFDDGLRVVAPYYAAVQR